MIKRIRILAPSLTGFQIRRMSYSAYSGHHSSALRTSFHRWNHRCKRNLSSYDHISTDEKAAEVSDLPINILASRFLIAHSSHVSY
jgi:hypothetical protein